MKEVVLRHFFEGHATVDELAADAEGAFERRVDSAGAVFNQLHATPMAEDFAVSASHVAHLVEAVQAGQLSLDALDAICFCLEASDHFVWDTDTEDGERVADALFWLGTPEINYPLTPLVLEKVHRYLLTGENTFTTADAGSSTPRPQLTINRAYRDRDV